jgi:hypothetical protein
VFNVASELFLYAKIAVQQANHQGFFDPGSLDFSESFGTTPVFFIATTNRTSPMELISCCKACSFDLSHGLSKHVHKLDLSRAPENRGSLILTVKKKPSSPLTIAPLLCIP